MYESHSPVRNNHTLDRWDTYESSVEFTYESVSHEVVFAV